MELPTYDEEELKKLVTVGNDCPSLLVYLQGFGITLKVLQQACKCWGFCVSFWKMPSRGSCLRSLRTP